MTREEAIERAASAISERSRCSHCDQDRCDICLRAATAAVDATGVVGLYEALEPFAREADEWNETVSDAYRPPQVEPGYSKAYDGAVAEYTVGDLRRARAALSAARGEGKEKP